MENKLNEQTNIDYCALLGKNAQELRQICQDLGMSAYKGGILFSWLQSGELDYGKMSNLSKADRAVLAERYPLRLPEIRREQRSADGTCAKLLLDYGEGILVELVIMLYQRQQSRNRHTLCISTQAGCAMGCAFCATGLSGLLRNLSAGEIVAQVLQGQLWLQRQGLGSVTNLVLMGMGEPLANYGQVCRAIRVLNAEAGQNIGQRRITVSTCGLAARIRRFADEGWEVNLAVSLHAPDDELRSRLLPVNKRFPLAELLAACDYYTAKTHRRISYEYALLRGVNDSPKQAQALAELLAGRLAHVNLIPVNFVEETGFWPSSDETLNKFAALLQRRGVETSVREKRGLDIDGACGQLRRRVVK